MNTPNVLLSNRIGLTDTLSRWIRRPLPSPAFLPSLLKPKSTTSPPSLMNSGKLEDAQRDHRKKIGSVRSKNCECQFVKEPRLKELSSQKVQVTGRCDRKTKAPGE